MVDVCIKSEVPNFVHCKNTSTLRLKNDIDVAHSVYNFNAHQPILVIFGTDVGCSESMLSNGDLLFHLS